jgi:tRNA (guanine37-N1)-methyltransferase
MEIEILSLFPEYFLGPFNESILKRAQERGLISIRHTQIRDFAVDKHRRVDDRPYGGGPGMVLKPEPMIRAIRSVKRPNSHVISFSPQGKLLTAAMCRTLSQRDHLILLCGHYEGMDERIIELEVDEEISIGDYVVTNGALAAIILVDAVARFIPEVLGHPAAATLDSFENGLLECPHYTRPETFEGLRVPDVLLNGDHQAIADWRGKMAEKKTAEMRPDLYQRYLSQDVK